MKEIYTINKVKYGKDKKVKIEYSLGENEYTISSINPPKPELLLALWNLAEDVNEICDLHIDENKVLDYIQIIGVSLSEGENGTGVTISGLKKLSKYSSFLVVNTPHLFDGTENEDQLIPFKTLNKVKDLLRECNLYLNGEYGDGYQMDLFPDKKDEKKLKKEKKQLASQM